MAEELLRQATGFDDVKDVLAMLNSLEPDDVEPYLSAFLPDAALAKRVARALHGAQARDATTSVLTEPRAQKKHEQRLPTKLKPPRAAPPPPAADAAAAAPSDAARPPKLSKRGRQAAKKASVQLTSVQLLPGRHPCSCNARRHALLYNCLSCGAIICEQQGVGPCLFCGEDPNQERGAVGGVVATDEAARLRAEAHAARLLDFDRTSAKRTAVIDDQSDWWGDAQADAWLSQAERAKVKADADARAAEAEKRRRQFRITIDVDERRLVRDDPDCGGREAGGSAAAAANDHESSETGARPGPSRQAAPLNRDSSGSAGGGMLSNPTVATRAVYIRSREDASSAASAGEKLIADAMSEGLKHSVLKVQHDDPWVESFLALEREEPDALQALAALGISNTIEPPRHSLPAAKAESPAPAAETCLAPASPYSMAELDLLEGVQTAGSVLRSIMLRRGGGFPEVLCDGMVLLRSALDVAAQQAVVDICRELGVGPGGFYSPKTRDGAMHLKMMCLGKHWDPVTSKYTATREVDGATPPLLPTLLWEPVVAAVAAARAASTSIPEVQPGVCLVNYYSHGGRLGMHQDRSESAEALRRGSPVVSLSIGDACEFAYSQTPPPRDGDEALGLPPPRSVRLDSGDLLVFGGPSRLVWHGITKIYPRQRPGELRLIPGRLNLTFREF